MIAYWRNLVYILRHKWFVFMACCQLGIPWRGLVHDLSKFRPDEFTAYARYFYGSGRTAYSPSAQRAISGDDPAFDLAWHKHIRRNDHHWQAWVLHQDDGQVKLMPMPGAVRREMLADWRGAGRARGSTDTRGWYLDNRDNILLHPETRAWVEAQLGIAP